MRAVALEDLRPSQSDGLPAVNWQDTPSPAELYEKYDAQVAGATVASLRYLAKSEPAVTGDVVWALPDTARPYGMEFRMKSPGSLAKKISRKSQLDPDATPYDISEHVSDLLRYTGVARSADEVLPMARETVRRLKRRGWSILEAEHSYVDGNPYKGVHAVMRHRDTGQAVEIQFHSEDSIGVKEKSHPLYEVMRDEDKPLADRGDAHRRMATMWADVPHPVGLESFTVLGGKSVVAKVYPNRYDNEEKGHTS